MIKPIKLILADDHEIFRDGFRAMLKKQSAIKLIAEADNGEDLVKICMELKPDIVITDIKMPKMDGIEATKKITAEINNIGVIALSMFDEENLIFEMLESGAKGYLLKNAHKNEIIEAINTVYQNKTYYCTGTSIKLAQMIAKSSLANHLKRSRMDFSDREKEVIQYICEEMLNKEIASKMNLSVRTIEGYRERIQDKIGAKNTAGVVVFAIKNDLFKVK